MSICLGPSVLSICLLQGCVMNLTQGHIAKVKVTVHTFQIPCPDNNLLVLFHSIVVKDQGCAMTLTQGHISKVKVILQT